MNCMFNVHENIIIIGDLSETPQRTTCLIADPSKTDMPDRRLIVDLNMPDQRPIGDQHAPSEISIPLETHR